MSGYARLLRKLGHHRWAAELGIKLSPLDRRLYRLSRGRLGVVGFRSAPRLLLTATGRSSGIPRTVPLLFTEVREGFVVVGSNAGRDQHPAWTGNLLAHPDASVQVRGRTQPVRARLVDGAERERLWQSATSLWPAYDSYADRTDREIRLFLLEPQAVPTP
jgi:deazaflavin-dependent oxidoreductase (nitroreductase family)